MSKIGNGFLWSSVERFSTQGISFLVSIIIARLVAPNMYGLIALIQVFISLGQVFIDSGFGNALIQKQNRKEIDYNTVLIFNLIVAIILYVILFISAPFIADFYGEPRLKLITRIVAFNLILSSLCIVQRTRLTIGLDFKTQAKASLIATIISGLIGIVAAYLGYEVWALVLQTILSQIIQAVVLMTISNWTPKWQFSYESFKSMFSFGSKLLVNNLITSLYINIANLTIGKFYTPASLAFYNRGFSLALLPSTNVESVLQRIIYPLTCEAQDDKDKLKFIYFKYLHLSHFFLLPILTLMCVLSVPIIYVLLTEKWLPAADFVSLFSVNFMLYAWTDQSGSVTNAVGRSDLNLRGTFIKRPIAFFLLFVSLSISVKAICYATILSSVIELIVNMHYTNKVLSISYWNQIKPQLDVIAINFLLGITIYGITLFLGSMIMKLIIGCLLGMLLYISCAYVFKLEERKFLTEILKKIKNGR